MKDNFKTFPKLVADPTTNEQNIIAWKNRVEKELREKLNREIYKEKGYCPVWDNGYDYGIKEILG